MNSNVAVCPNCDHELRGQYCSNCGQSQKGVDRFFLTLVNEAFEGLFSLESKAWRTTIYLLFRPGLLSKEYFNNRRARYITPIRLYLITSIAFFLLLSGIAFFAGDIKIGSTTPDGTQPEVVSETVVEEASTTNTTLKGVSSNQEGADVLSQAEDDAGQTSKNIDKAIDGIHVNLAVPFTSEKKNKELNTAMEEKLKSSLAIAKERPELLIDKLIDSSPPVVLLLLPLFALVLKIFYIGSNRYYAQHLVLALHNHSFLFAAMFVIGLISVCFDNEIGSTIQYFIWMWIGIYMCLSLKTAFEQSWPVTLLKSTVLLMIYIVLFSAALVCISLLGIILI